MLPKAGVVFTSYRCNSRCLMCSAWQKQKGSRELAPEEIEKIFSDKLLKENIEIINLTGGEPTIRDDLADIVKVIVKNLPKLRRIDIPTNGINTEEIIDKLERILSIILPSNARLAVTVSLDGIGEAHERVRGMAGIFDKIQQTIQELKELESLYPSLSVGLNMTVSKANYGAIGELNDYALKNKININYTLATISDIGVASSSAKDKFTMNQGEINNAIFSLRKLLQNKSIDPYYARFLFIWLKTGKRKGSCIFRSRKAFLLDPDGETYVCGNFKEFRIGNILHEPFERAWKRSSGILRQNAKKCLTCASNCYIGEKL